HRTCPRSAPRFVNASHRTVVLLHELGLELEARPQLDDGRQGFGRKAHDRRLSRKVLGVCNPVAGRWRTSVEKLEKLELLTWTGGWGEQVGAKLDRALIHPEPLCCH